MQNSGGSDMFLSVNIPVYNCEKYLRQCIDSVLAQTFADFELILADDGSTDLSGAICDEYAAKDERIKVLHSENGGAVRARRLAFEQNSGDYVFFMDGDDTADADLFERVHAACVAHRSDILAFGFKMTDGGNTVLGKNGFPEGLYEGKRLAKVRKSLIYDRHKRSFNYGGVIYSLWSKVYRRDFLDKYLISLPPEIVKGEDMVQNTVMLSAAKSVYFADCYGYNYRITPGSVMAASGEGEIANYQKVYSFLTANVPSVSKNSVAVWVMYMFLNYCRSAADTAKTYTEFEEIIERNTDERFFEIIRLARLYLPKPNDIRLIRLAKGRKFKKLYSVLKGESI